MKNKKIKILFFHFDLGYGGAERVLVNLLNNLDPEKYDITLMTLFHHGVAAKDLHDNIKWKWVLDRKPFRGITYLLRVFGPKLLHKVFIKEKYDFEIAYIEGAPTRIVSGCTDKSTKKFAWVHVQLDNFRSFFHPFRSKAEVIKCYNSFDGLAGVSEYIVSNFKEKTENRIQELKVVNNTLEIDEIIRQSQEPITIPLDSQKVNLCSVGRFNIQKGYDRLINALINLKKEGISNFHLYLLGIGELKEEIEEKVKSSVIKDDVTFLGYDTNPHKYVSKMDFFVCSSYREGYSTAVTESIINKVPVLTTDCSGMSEILGESGAGIIVENDEKALQAGLQLILTDKELRDKSRRAAAERSTFFSKENTIKQFEQFIGTFTK